MTAARAPILAGAIYAGFLVWPDQTAEVMRSTFENNPFLLFWYLFGWAVLTFCIVFAFFAATRFALGDFFKEPACDRTQSNVVYVVTVLPIAALFIAFAKSLDQNVSVALGTHWLAILLFFIFPVLLLVGLVELHENDKSFSGWGTILAGIAFFVWIFIAAAIVILRVISYYFATIPDPPAVWIFSTWISIFLGLLMLLELRRIWTAPLISLFLIWALLLAYFDVSDNHVVRTVKSR